MAKTEEKEKFVAPAAAKISKKSARKKTEKHAGEKIQPKYKKAALSQKEEKAYEKEIFIQHGGKELTTWDLYKRVEDLWTEEMGHKAGELVDLKIYVKAEENKAYYVCNGEIKGSIRLF